MKPLTIGKVARLAGVGVETIRFYERKGLIPEPPRKESGYRQYPEEAVYRIRFIRRARELGFSLQEAKELLSVRGDPESTCENIRNRAEAKIADIEDKIRTLAKMKDELAKLVAACDAGAPISECPILAALDEKSKEVQE